MTKVVHFHAVLAIAGAFAVAAFVLFGDSLHHIEGPKKKKAKKGGVPGLTNIGNTCFLNCILQALASCPFYNQWLILQEFKTVPSLLSALKHILKVLNSESLELDANANEVLKALKNHGWVISLEEQDAHELFHALTSTIDDELGLLRQEANSLLNVSWVSEKTDSEEKIVCPNAANPLFLCKDTLQLESQETTSSGGSKSSSFEALSYKEVSIVSVNDDNHTDNQSIENEELNLLKIKPVLEEIPPQPPVFPIQISPKHHPSIITRVQTGFNEVTTTSERSTQNESPFKGLLASQLQCTFCGYKNAEQWNTFESLSLSLPSSVNVVLQKWSLEHLLQAFIRPETVSEVSCESCSKTLGKPFCAPFVKQLTIGKLPDCLCIHIQRNTWSGSGCTVKRRDHVIIPERMDMDPYTYSVNLRHQSVPEQGPTQELATSAEQNENKSSTISVLEDSLSSLCSTASSFLAVTRAASACFRIGGANIYQLQAVVVHVGDAFSGHFVTYRRGSIHSSFRERWFYTSDLMVKEVTLDEVLQSNAYMILYEKVTS